jgi:hypothetical protein
MSQDDINYDEIRRRVEQCYDDLKNWVIHALVFVTIIAALIVAFGANKYTIGFTLLWLSGFVAHTVDTFADFVTVGLRRRAIQHEIEMELYYRDGQVPSFMKRKRQPQPERLGMSDDGELVVMDDPQETIRHTTVEE